NNDFDDEKNLYYAIMKVGIKENGEGYTFYQILTELNKERFISDEDFQIISRYREDNLRYLKLSEQGTMCNGLSIEDAKFKFDFEKERKSFINSQKHLFERLTRVMSITNKMYRGIENTVFSMTKSNSYTGIYANTKCYLLPDFNCRYYEFIELQEAREATKKSLFRSSVAISISIATMVLSSVIMIYFSNKAMKNEQSVLLNDTQFKELKHVLELKNTEAMK
ncbi:MAG: hypothetical protein JW982_16620, partial [Spirochaetes bacterium]|nr:hypothetical protein [Spirochaetota bacterium]